MRWNNRRVDSIAYGLVSAFILAYVGPNCSNPIGQSGGSPISKQPAARISISAISSSSTGLNKTLSAAGSEIESFKINVTSVLLYENVIMNGSAASPTANLYLYSGPADAAQYPDYNADSARKSDLGYIDFANTSSLAQLSGSTAINEDVKMLDSIHQADSIFSGVRSTDTVVVDTFKNTGIYRYVYVGFMRPFKIKGSVVSIAGDTCYTKDGVVEANGQDFSLTRSPRPLTEGPSEEAIVMKDNGGTLFRLLRPIVVTKQDVVDSTIFRVLLIFNPNGFLSAYNSRQFHGGADGGISDTAGNVIKVPFLDIAPIAYRDGQTVVRETYLFSDLSQNIYTTLELCTVKEDSTNIYGANIRGIAMNASQLPQDFQNIMTVDETGANLTFKDMNGVALIENFQRNSSGTADIYYGPNKSAGVSYSLTEKKAIQ